MRINEFFIDEVTPRFASKALVINGMKVVRSEAAPGDHYLILGERKWSMPKPQADAMLEAIRDSIWDVITKGGSQLSMSHYPNKHGDGYMDVCVDPDDEDVFLEFGGEGIYLGRSQVRGLIRQLVDYLVGIE